MSELVKKDKKKPPTLEEIKKSLLPKQPIEKYKKILLSDDYNIGWLPVFGKNLVKQTL